MLKEVDWSTRQEIWGWEEDRPLSKEDLALVKDLYFLAESNQELLRNYKAVLKNVLS